MRKTFLLLAITSAISCLAAKDDPKYPVSAIPENLKENVNVVIREHSIVVKIPSKNRMTTTVHLVITILNRNGKDYATEVVSYDKLSKVTYFQGVVYDAMGDVIKKLKGSEIMDQSAYDGYSLYSDNRIKYGDLAQGDYPYTVEFEYETEQKYLYGIKGMYPLSAEKLSVQKASYQVYYKPDVAPRYKTKNIEGKPVHASHDGGMESLLWKFENLKPIKAEPFGPNFSDLVPSISVAPTKFEYEGYEGDMSTWDSYAKWEAKLLVGREVLPPLAKQKVVEITKDLKTTEEKTKALYEYLQNKTRYVSISLGIGGLQPFEASVVDQVGYGDCKALSNYMVALLREAGIKGHYTTVMAGDEDFTPDLSFPSHQGNHVIVAVPDAKDTLWLECTDQSKPFGYAGRFTGDRKAFMLTDNGGVWVNTPSYDVAQNLQTTTVHVYVDKTVGDATAKIKITYAGIQYENGNLDRIVLQQTEEQKKWAQNFIRIPSFDVSRISMKNVKEKVPSAIVDMELSLKRYATISGKRMFINPNLLNRSSIIPEKVENRKTKIHRRMAFTDYDTIHYHIPEEFYPEFLPEPVKIKSRFGEYEASFKLDAGELIYFRRVKMLKGVFPAESYTEFMDFYRSMNKADNVKLVFVNKT